MLLVKGWFLVSTYCIFVSVSQQGWSLHNRSSGVGLCVHELILLHARPSVQLPSSIVSSMELYGPPGDAS